ncbi:hypothetical protein HK097_001440 [Rhizophlyctis rosea]|uniref:Uncharacterized protein n=1 Tax=Rhizophlyctis rosea TaxID=64517 RepID=A0AAD5WYB4_9FUNG|nr:hypothetical protein HK097_001440 [Rhizophlyctis rosea]
MEIHVARLDELYSSGNYQALLTSLTTCSSTDLTLLLYHALAHLQLREPELVLTSTRHILESETTETYYRALALLISSFAHEQLERFVPGLDDIQKLLSLRDDSTTPDPLPNSLKTFQNLKHPHPSHPINAQILLKRRDLLQKLVSQTSRIKNDAPPPALLRHDGGDGDTPYAFLYRVQPRILPDRIEIGVPFNLEFGLGNESGLWRRADWSWVKDVRFDLWICCWVDGRLAKSPDVELTVLESSEVSHAGHLHWTVSPYLASQRPPPIPATPLYLHIGALHPLTLPLLLGPLSISTPSTPHPPEDPSLTEYRALALPQPFHYLFIIDDPSGGIPSRIWDSCVAFTSTILSAIPASEAIVNPTLRKPGLKVLELGAGTGAGGLYLAAACPGATVVLTDVEGCLEGVRKNVEINADLLAKMNSTVRVLPLMWGNESQMSGVNEAIGPRQSRSPIDHFDIILALDVIYETEYFGTLLDTLDKMSGSETEVWIVYKKRGLEGEEEAMCFAALRERFQEVEGTADLRDLGKKVGCRWFRYRKRQSGQGLNC